MLEAKKVFQSNISELSELSCYLKILMSLTGCTYHIPTAENRQSLEGCCSSGHDEADSPDRQSEGGPRRCKSGQ